MDAIHRTTPDTMTDTPADLAEALNRGCACQTLQPALLQAQLAHDPKLRALSQTLQQTHPHLFSSTVVFLSEKTFQDIANTVAAVERVAQLPGWEQSAMPGASEHMRTHRGPQGAFMGYDFHVHRGATQLIEINTNAGGAFLNAALARAQTACCDAMDSGLAPYRNMATLEDDFFAMFQTEWHSQRGDSPWHTVAIVDDDPERQYLAPEFELARAMFAAHGKQALIADGRTLRWEAGRLWAGNTAIDLVYNRLTDFDLSDPQHTALGEAWRQGAVVLTPDPRHYALRANKSHLQTLSSANTLRALGASAQDIAILQAHVPACERVTPDNAAQLWEVRRSLFFKPLCGFGSRAVYRGDKLTKRVWEEIVAGNYIAQALVPPGERALFSASNDTALKFDVRAYAYAGQILLLAARMYQGQTTNFRTEGGGFAPVLVVKKEGIERFAATWKSQQALVAAQL